MSRDSWAAVLVRSSSCGVRLRGVARLMRCAVAIAGLAGAFAATGCLLPIDPVYLQVYEEIPLARHDAGDAGPRLYVVRGGPRAGQEQIAEIHIVAGNEFWRVSYHNDGSSPDYVVTHYRDGKMMAGGPVEARPVDKSVGLRRTFWPPMEEFDELPK